MRYLIGATIGITLAWYINRMLPYMLVTILSRGDH